VDDLKVKGPQIQGAYHMNVNQLFIPNIKVWDRGKIKTLFSLDMAKAIYPM
jgi:hypothetical protein